MPTILGANTLSTGYDVANSLRFDDGSSAYLNRTPSSASNRTTWTWSAWIKRSNLTGGQMALFGAKADSSNDTGIWLQSDDTLQFFNNVSGTVKQIRTNRLFRDSTAWYHIVAVWDSDNGTAGNRMRLYINGVEETSFGTDTNPGSGDNSTINNTEVHQIGRVDTTYYFDGYMAEVCFIDGQALDATSFGEFDEDSPQIWKPIDVSGLTFGTNGFYLDYEDSSNLGNDKSGGTDFTEVNLAATDQSTDTCTNNFATLNPLVKGNTSFTFLQGNIQVDSGNNWGHGVGTIGLASGKWYWEVDNITASSNVFFGICNEFNVSHLDNDSTPYSEAGLMLYFQDGRRTIDGTSSEGEYNAYGTTHGFALDLDSGTRTIKFYRDNSLEGTENLTANFPAGDFVFPILMMSASSNACGVDFNFGGTVASALASGNADANGYGSFEFAPPSGYYAICTKNLAEYG